MTIAKMTDNQDGWMSLALKREADAGFVKLLFELAMDDRVSSEAIGIRVRNELAHRTMRTDI